MERVVALNGAPFRPDAQFVLYWAQMNRRVESNHALLRAAEHANRLRLPVLYYEGLTCDYPSANDRLHTFILQGVPETARRLARLGIGYCFHLRRRRTDPNDILYRLAQDAACVVTDDDPAFVAACHNASVSAKLGIAFEAVDSSCVVPMRLLPKREYAAYTIRPKLRKLLPAYLRACPEVKVFRRWTAGTPPHHTEVAGSEIPSLVARCEIDHSVRPSCSFVGGRFAAEKTLARFVAKRLGRYAGERNEPFAHATSDLSPYLHFGQISSLEVALSCGDRSPEFLEELIVRRELAFNFALHAGPDASLDQLPAWALQTMADHAGDLRRPAYSYKELESARTHDELWNACQTEMLLRGKIHGYYRMYWGKKIIEWSPTYQGAFEAMTLIHERFALDGRDPNTVANILWCFGLHDRPWPERPVFGKIRFMSAEGMRRKTDVPAYLGEIARLEKTQCASH